MNTVKLKSLNDTFYKWAKNQIDKIPEIPLLDIDNVVMDLLVDKRDVAHDGYCSDPGEDFGETVRNIKRTICLFGETYSVLRHYNAINNDKMLFITKTIVDCPEGCDCGSGYCGYTGTSRVTWCKIKEP
uniref:Uncharacterized protein n=1 Tax=viral metagenome TaxID=1070528 RepID=A0A6C0J5V5_9ZZZZ